MTAAVHPTTITEAVLAPATVASLDEFLRDPIGYGTYDFTDPISLVEFSNRRHHHGIFVSWLT